MVKIEDIGETCTFVLYKEERDLVKELAAQLLDQTGKYSKSEACRMLIQAGAEALKLK